MTPPNHHDQLTRFAEQQLRELSTRDICASTVHLILTTAFFTGAAIGLAKPLRANKHVYRASLQDFLHDRFGLSTDNAAGMVEANARLYKRYVLVEKIYNAGWQAAQAWYTDPAFNESTLSSLLTQYRGLSMSGLNIEGSKEQKVAPGKVEAIAKVDITPTAVAEPPRRGRRLLWVGIVALLAITAYFVLFPENIPAPLLEQIPTKWRTFLRQE